MQVSVLNNQIPITCSTDSGLVTDIEVLFGGCMANVCDDNSPGGHYLPLASKICGAPGTANRRQNLHRSPRYSTETTNIQCPSPPRLNIDNDEIRIPFECAIY